MPSLSSLPLLLLSPALSLLVPPAQAQDESGPLRRPCGTVPQAAPLRQPPPPGGGDLRDAYGVPNLETSTHFVLRWGDTDTPSSTAVDTLLAALEASYGVLVDGLDMPPPLGTDTHLFNVYIGDTGSGAPSASGAAGYYTFDRQGWPMIVLSQGVVDDLVYGRSVIAHELFHALQSATGNYEYTATSSASWFWEATAEWAAGEVYPEDAYHAQFLTAFAFYPHFPLDYFNYPDEGLFLETYQYGAFIFPRYLSEVQGRPEWVRDAWTDPGDARDPLAAIEADMVAEGLALLPLVADFYAHNTLWDYENGALYADIVDYYGGFYEEQDFREADWATLEADEAGAWREGPAATLPSRFGANIITLSARDACGTLSMAFDGADEGSAGSAASWAGVLVLHSSGRSSNDVPAYIPLSDAETVTLDLDGATQAVNLVVVPASAVGVSGEDFAYAYAWTFAPADDREAAGCVETSGGSPGGAVTGGTPGGLSEPPGGCSCSQAQAFPGWRGGGLLLLLLSGWVAVRGRCRRAGERSCWI